MCERNVELADDSCGVKPQSRFPVKLAGKGVLDETCSETAAGGFFDRGAAFLGPGQLEALRALIERSRDLEVERFVRNQRRLRSLIGLVVPISSP